MKRIHSLVLSPSQYSYTKTHIFAPKPKPVIGITPTVYFQAILRLKPQIKLEKNCFTFFTHWASNLPYKNHLNLTKGLSAHWPLPRYTTAKFKKNPLSCYLASAVLMKLMSMAEQVDTVEPKASQNVWQGDIGIVKRL